MQRSTHRPSIFFIEKNAPRFLALAALLLATASLLSGCDFLFGSRHDETVDEVFEQGAIDPTLVPDKVGYVPIFPFWEGFSNPVDVFVGYDEMVYVIDDRGLNILDHKGTLHNTIHIPGATDVIQDRRIHTYVAGRVDIDINDDLVPENLAAVFRLENAGTGAPVFIDTLIHPFNDPSRNNTAFRPDDDPLVAFTGLATLADNTLYVARTGPRNSLTAIARPDNAILFFDAQGANTGYAVGLSPIASSLKSVIDVSAIATFIGPPQSLSGFSTSADFLVLQTDPKAEFKALWIVKTVDPEVGVAYLENPRLASFDRSKADRFLYEPFRFDQPADVYLAPDFSSYIFIVDSQRDSLYQFTPAGYEGVNPPPNSGMEKQVPASFGGKGSGPFQFDQPSGVCYFEKTVYVADKGNNRICRFRLSTDLE